MGAVLKKFGKNLWDSDRSILANTLGLMGPLGMMAEQHINKKEDLFNEMKEAPDQGFDASKGYIDEGKAEQLARLDPLMQEMQDRQSELSKWYMETKGKSYQDTAEAQGALTRAKEANADEMNTIENSALQAGMTPEQKLAYKAKIKENYDAMLGGLAEKDTDWKKGNRDEYNSLSNLYMSNKANLAGAQNAVTGTATGQTLGAEAMRQGQNFDWMNRRLQGYENFEKNAFQLGGKALDFAGEAVGPLGALLA